MVRRIFLYILIIFNICPVYSKEPPIFNEQEKLSYINIEWWQKFEDPYLSSYIVKAVLNNHDAKKIVYKTEQFRQQVRYTLGNELPSASVSADYLGVKVPLLDNFRLRRNAFILPFQFNYEADLLQKNRDKTRSVNKLFRAQKYNEQSVYIMLASDVGTTYINILKFDKTIELQKNLIKNQSEILERTRKLYSQGTISKTELNKEEQSLNDLNSDMESLLKSRHFLLTQLAQLIAQSPECTDNLERSDFDTFALNMSTPCEISSDLIFNRPDVLEALSKLQSARIDVRVAKKEFFPTFNITGFYVFNTLGPGNFFSWRATLASIIAGVSQDIYTGGKKLANLRLSKAKYRELLEEYFEVDLKAIKEVNDALYQMKYDLGIINEAFDKFSLERNNYSLNNHRYKRGTISYLNLLEKHNDLIEQRQNYTEKKTAKFIDAISLYKSVGGQL